MVVYGGELDSGDEEADPTDTELQKEYNNQVEQYKKNKTTLEPSISIARWLQTAHWGRITSSFPELGLLHDTKAPNFTLEELIAKKWLRTRKGALYELKRMEPLYERHIKAIAGIENCPKMRASALVSSRMTMKMGWW